jgi:hypothetical protein
VHTSRSESVCTQRGSHCRVDPARDADDDLREAILLHVILEAEREREAHLLELRLERDTLRREHVVMGRRSFELDPGDVGSRLTRAIQLATTDIAEPSTHGVGRIDVDDEQVLLKAGRARDDFARRVEDDGVAVEHELVLPADHVAEREVGARVACPRDQHLLALLGLSDVERRGREVHDELRPCESEVGRRWAGLPDVFADRRPDVRRAELKQHEVTALGEVAMLVENAVVRKELLPVHGLHATFGTDHARVGQIPVEPRCADERHETGRRRCDLVERLAGRAHEAWPKEEILGWIAGCGELRKDDDVGSDAPGFREGVEDPRSIPAEVADHCVQLAESDSHGFRLTVTNRV